MTFSMAPSFDGLADLARRDGIDIRPVLVRVLTDLYVQKDEHTAEEEEHYVELMLRFVGTTDIATRVNVARKLARYDAAPLAVLNMLARDVIEVADPILRHSGRLGTADLVALAECGPAHAAVIVARRQHQPERMPPAPVPPAREPAEAARTPTPTPIPPKAAIPVASATGSQAAAAKDMAVQSAPSPAQPTLAGAPENPPSAPKPSATHASDADLARVFFAAASPARRRLLADLVEGGDAMAPRADPATMKRLETAALQRKPEVFVLELEQALGIARAQASRIVQDDGGEPLLVALKALGVPGNVVLRILLFLNPAIGQSVEQVFRLDKLYREIAQDTADRLLCGLRGSSPARSAARHQPALVPEPLPRARDALSPGPRRGAPGRPGQADGASMAQEWRQRSGKT